MYLKDLILKICHSFAKAQRPSQNDYYHSLHISVSRHCAKDIKYAFSEPYSNSVSYRLLVLFQRGENWCSVRQNHFSNAELEFEQVLPVSLPFLVCQSVF